MDPMGKYCFVLSEDPIRKAVLRSLYAVVRDEITRMTFRMATESQARFYLTDEDFDLWLRKKNEYQERTGDIIPF